CSDRSYRPASLWTNARSRVVAPTCRSVAPKIFSHRVNARSRRIRDFCSSAVSEKRFPQVVNNLASSALPAAGSSANGIAASQATRASANLLCACISKIRFIARRSGVSSGAGKAGTEVTNRAIIASSRDMKSALQKKKPASMRPGMGLYDKAHAHRKDRHSKPELAAAQRRPSSHQLRRLLPTGDLEGKSKTQIESGGAIGTHDFLDHLACGPAVAAVAAHHGSHFGSVTFQTLRYDTAALVDHDE